MTTNTGRRDANIRGGEIGRSATAPISVLRAGLVPKPLAGQSTAPAANSTGAPLTPSDYHPNLPSPTPMAQDARQAETKAELGKPEGIHEGLGEWFNAAFGCGPEDPGCNG